MKLVYKKDSFGYFLQIIDNIGYSIILDQTISRILDITWEEYMEILKNNNASNDGIKYFNNFKNEEDIKNTIKNLEKYLVMVTLIQ